jgi:hypothetical protein
MTGFLDGMRVEQLTPGKACMPKGMTGNRVKTVFEDFMRDYPKRQTETIGPPFIISSALFRAFRCPSSTK